MNPSRLLFLVLALSFWSPAHAQTMGTRPYLSVQGTAKARVKPDVFPIEITISDTGMNAARSQKLVEDLSTLALDAAQKQGLADTDIEVGNISITPDTEWSDKTEEDVFKGNEYQRKLKFRFHDLASLRAFIVAIPESRNVQMQTRAFEYSGQQELKRKLRREAIEDAKRGAADMADAVGKRLVELYNVSDRAQSTIYSASGYNYDGLSSVALLAPGTVRGRSSDIVLREGEIELTADAFLVYVIGD